MVDGVLPQPLDRSSQERFNSYPYDAITPSASHRDRWHPRVSLYQWHRLVVDVVHDAYSVEINGVRGPRFFNVDDYRGRPQRENSGSGFIGLQASRGNAEVEAILTGRRPGQPAPTVH